MFGDINRAEVLGNVTQDPQLRQTGTGKSVCSFSVATNRRFLVNEEWREEVQFINIVLWGRRAESFAQRAKKGTRVYAEGRISTRNWEDANGVKQYRTEIIAGRIILIDRYVKNENIEGAAGGESSGVNSAADNTKTTKSKTKVKKQQAGDEETIDPDDLPF